MEQVLCVPQTEPHCVDYCTLGIGVRSVRKGHYLRRLGTCLPEQFWLFTLILLLLRIFSLHFYTTGLPEEVTRHPGNPPSDAYVRESTLSKMYVQCRMLYLKLL